MDDKELDLFLRNRRPEKFIHINGKASISLNPEWIKQNYPDTYDEISKQAILNERRRIEDDNDEWEVRENIDPEYP